MLLLSLLLVVSLQHIITATNIYYVASNNSSNHGSDTESLEYYLNNTRKYLSSNSQLHFKPGQYYLNVDLIVQNVISFSMIGEGSCKVSCVLYSSIMLVNVTNFTLENINFKNCNKNHSDDLHTTFDYDYISISKPSPNASIFLYNCTSVVINNISVSVNAGTTGILVVNVRSYSTLNNVSITVNYTICPTVYEHPEQINGILLYYDRLNNKTTDMQLDNFQFTTNGLCAHPSQYAITLLLFQNNTNISVMIKNTNFNNLRNVGALYYYGESCGILAKNNLTFENCVISNNTGNLIMFEIIQYNSQCLHIAFLQHYWSQQSNYIRFINCRFVDNHNITSMIHVTPPNSRTITGYIIIRKASFCHNNNAHFLTMRTDTGNIWQLSNFVYINTLNMTSNRHFDGRDLISVINCAMKFIGTIFIANNSLYRNIIRLYMSGSIFQRNITIVNNTARQILDGLYTIFMQENTMLNVSYNTVYKLFVFIRQTLTLARPFCVIQFNSNRGSLDSLNITKLPFKVVAFRNIHVTSKTLIEKRWASTNCQWLAGTAFHTQKSAEVYKQIIDVQNLVIGNDIKRSIPLSVCRCQNLSSGVKSSDHDCYSPYLGSVYPGETLTVHLRAQEQWINDDNPITIIVENLSDQDDCSIVHASELSQTYFNNTKYCNSYRYTLWPKNASVKECQLFTGLRNMPEMFYVQVKPCPKGFTLQAQRKACYCDPLLSIKISFTSCNVKDETILRPANSWIYADTDENLHTYVYQVSLRCPFDHCFPEPSHLNLSNPDSQCQFNRIGILCGQCQQGLSTVFGSSQCKFCTNAYLYIIIPLTMAGIALVIILFIFNLTVANGKVNFIIFYANIISINSSFLLANYHSVGFAFISLLNLDLGIETCFYNGMTDYAKMWLQLMFPFYLFIIIIVIVVGSRHSIRIQRLTRRRVLPVLATLLLLCYTKILRIVCSVLLYYTTITHIPSDNVEVVWMIDTGVPLFGIKFIMLSIMCFILFLIILPFSVILLFSRKLSNFKFITYFKPLLDAYHGPYKDAFSYWVGLQLLIRKVILVLSVFDKRINFLSVSILLGVIFCIHGVTNPFINRFHNVQEALILLNLLAIYVTAYYNTSQSTESVIVTSILLATVSLYFVACFTYSLTNVECIKNHKVLGLFKRFLNGMRQNLCQKNGSNSEINSTLKLSSVIPDVTYTFKEFQEPLLAVDN